MVILVVMFTTRDTVGLVGHGVFAGTNYHVDISPRDAEVKQPEQVNARQRTSTLVNARRSGRQDWGMVSTSSCLPIDTVADRMLLAFGLQSHEYESAS